MKTIKWGIIGCGDVCEKKAGPALYGVEGCELTAVMRRNGELAKDFAKRHNVSTYYDNVGELLANPEINFIYVATPDEFHEEYTIAASEAGKHVLVEKAMALTAEGCQNMIESCSKNERILAVAYYRRCYPIILKAQEMLQQGAIGQVKKIWMNDEFPLSHRLDLFHFFAGDIDSVLSRTEELPPGSYQKGTGPVLYLNTKTGIEGSTNLGWKEIFAPEVVRIEGERGTITVADLKKGDLKIEVDGNATNQLIEPFPATHWGLVRNVYDFFNGNAPLACDGVEGRKSTVILDIVNELKDDGKPVLVDYSMSNTKTAT